MDLAGNVPIPSGVNQSIRSSTLTVYHDIDTPTNHSINNIKSNSYDPIVEFTFHILSFAQKLIFRYNYHMSTPEIAATAFHEIPDDVKLMLLDNPKVLEVWNKITPIMRNEWICWITIVKKPETRIAHIERLKNDLLLGHKSVCCWPGCPHRRPQAAKYFKKNIKFTSKLSKEQADLEV